jgi:hypothetical protein
MKKAVTSIFEKKKTNSKKISALEKDLISEGN